MKQKIILLFLVCCPILIHAADIPVIVNQNAAASQQDCVNTNADRCVSDCTNSPDIRCQDKCPSQAQAQCKEKMEE